MHQTFEDSRKYYETDQFQMIELPFRHTCVFGVILPKCGVTPKDFDVLELNNYVKRLNNNYHQYDMFVTLPKFQQNELEIDLKQHLAPYVPKLFDSSYTGIDRMMSDRNDLYVSMFRQKIVFKVDEKGAEGAVATICMNDCLGINLHENEKKLFKADHPFIYYIRDNTTDGLMFYGVYNGSG